ncbi:MAG: CorA family divalent cation transporter [bacterium]|nr:CorA family divalent cation transporter [bacterium]
MRIIKHKLIWIDVLNPTKKDVEFVRKQHKFHPIVLDELLHTSARSRVEPYDNYLYLTYHLPMYDRNIKSSRRAEVDFLITKDKIITVHYEDLEPLNNFWRRLNNDKNFKDRAMGDNTGRMIYQLIEEILAFSHRQLRHIEESVSELSRELFKNQEARLLEQISYLKRDILDYSIISEPQKIILESLKEVGGKFWGENIKIYLSDLAGDHLKIMQELDNFKETVNALEQTNSQLLNAKTNAVMQRFTVLAFLTFPLVLFTSMFNVSFISNYIGNNPILFSGAFLFVLTLTILMLLFARKKGWL